MILFKGAQRVCTISLNLKKSTDPDFEKPSMFKSGKWKTLKNNASTGSGRETWRFYYYTNLETTKFLYRILYNH
jgi:hypothetical protein